MLTELVEKQMADQNGNMADRIAGSASNGSDIVLEVPRCGHLPMNLPLDRGRGSFFLSIS